MLNIWVLYHLLPSKEHSCVYIERKEHAQVDNNRGRGKKKVLRNDPFIFGVLRKRPKNFHFTSLLLLLSDSKPCRLY